jgi:hypothetical protein
MWHHGFHHPREQIERTILRSLLLLVILGQAQSATFEGYLDLKLALDACLREVPTGEQCCSSGAANCGSAGTTDIPDWDVSNILNMKGLFSPFGDAFNQDISRWNVSQVQSMSSMFSNAPTFDADITSWDTSSLVASDKMFLTATAWLAEYERKDGMEVWMGIGCSSGDGVPLPGNTSCFDGPPSAWRRKDLPQLPPSSPHLESPPPPAQAVTSPPLPPGSVPEVSPPLAPAYDSPTTSVGVGAVILIAFIMLVVGFMSGYVVRLWRSKKGVPILDEDPDEEDFDRAQLSST